MSKDGKDKFYRGLNIDEESKEIIKWMRNNKKALMNDKVSEDEDE